jgi:hypothetical protein
MMVHTTQGIVSGTIKKTPKDDSGAHCSIDCDGIHHCISYDIREIQEECDEWSQSVISVRLFHGIFRGSTLLW